MSEKPVSHDFKLYPGVVLGEGAHIGFAAEVGVPVAHLNEPLAIGKQATIRSHSVLYTGSRIGDFFVSGHGALIREQATIGNQVSIGSHSVLEHLVTIEDGVRVHSNSFIPEYTIVRAQAWIGPGVVITNARYPAGSRSKEMLTGVTVETRARIGAHATILPGVRIGEGALVGAGSVVTRDVEPFAMVAGNPAKLVGDTREIRHHDGTPIYG